MIRLYDTRKRRKLEFTPLSAGKVGIYVCGVTVYDICHVGHARTLVSFDVIVRHLRASGFDVRFVRNITDVDDKIIRRGQQEGRDSTEVAREYADAMARDLAALGVATPDEEPRATENIEAMHGIIAMLEQKNLAYAAAGDVYYSVPNFQGYGQLSGQNPDDLKAGARIEIGEQKRSPMDFALWKGAKPGEPQWSSPWGPGRPGWHIECSAMAHRFLGERFDIHGGGADLIFPHHENELAQSCGAFGEDSFAQHWMHSGMVNFGGEKMSKSLGNVVSIARVCSTHDPETLRLLLISVHYRSPASFEIRKEEDGTTSFPDLDEQETRLEYFYRTLDRIDAFARTLKDLPADPLPSGFINAYRAAMDDDFNTAAAIGHLYDTFVQANTLLDDPKSAPKPERAARLIAIARDVRAAGATLGILQRDPKAFLLQRRERLCLQRKIDPAEIEQQIADRLAARRDKDFARADAIRDALVGRSIELMDSPDGTVWRVK